MQKLHIEDTDIDGLTIIHPFLVEDERGYFSKTFESDIFNDFGISFHVQESLQSYSTLGVIRGLHFQRQHPQTKLIRVVKGEIFDVVVDLRQGSKTFGEWRAFTLSEENRLQLLVSGGFAHGFMALSKEVVVVYHCDGKYIQEEDSGIIWSDKDLAVQWPIEKSPSVIVSQKDEKLQTYQEFLKVVSL